MKFKSELKELESNIQEVLYFCEMTKKTQIETIEVLELLFDHYRSNSVDLFFEWDYYEKYVERLHFIRQFGGNMHNETETLFI